jgi:hypothetical protein
VLDSNLGQDTDYPDCVSSWFSPILSNSSVIRSSYRLGTNHALKLYFFFFAKAFPLCLSNTYCITRRIGSMNRSVSFLSSLLCSKLLLPVQPSYSSVFHYRIYLWLYSLWLGLGRLFSFLIYTKLVGLLGRGISPSQGRYLRTRQHKQNKRTQTSMSQVGFEPTIPASVRSKTIHALDRAAAVIGYQKQIPV